MHAYTSVGRNGFNKPWQHMRAMNVSSTDSRDDHRDEGIGRREHHADAQENHDDQEHDFILFVFSV